MGDQGMMVDPDKMEDVLILDPFELRLIIKQEVIGPI